MPGIPVWSDGQADFIRGAGPPIAIAIATNLRPGDIVSNDLLAEDIAILRSLSAGRLDSRPRLFALVAGIEAVPGVD